MFFCVSPKISSVRYATVWKIEQCYAIFYPRDLCPGIENVPYAADIKRIWSQDILNYLLEC